MARLPHLEVIFHLRIKQRKNIQIIPDMIKAEQKKSCSVTDHILKKQDEIIIFLLS